MSQSFLCSFQPHIWSAQRCQMPPKHVCREMDHLCRHKSVTLRLGCLWFFSSFLHNSLHWSSFTLKVCSRVYVLGEINHIWTSEHERKPLCLCAFCLYAYQSEATKRLLTFIHMCTHVNRKRGCTKCAREVFIQCVCVCVRVGVGGRGWVCVFVCQINYLNPVTIKAEICYQRPPLEAHVSALLPQYALGSPPPRLGSARGRIKITGTES